MANNIQDEGFVKCELLPITLEDAKILIDVFDTFFVCFPKDIDNKQKLKLYTDLTLIRDKLEG